MSIIEKLGITKGRWMVNGYTGETDVFEIMSQPSNFKNGVAYRADWVADLCIDNTDGGFEVVKNNAQLIACAPEMLEALIYALKENERPCDDCVTPNGCDCWVNRSIYVIEKATGKTWPEIKELLNE